MDSVLSNMGLLDNSNCMAVLYGRGYRLWLMAFGFWLMVEIHHKIKAVKQTTLHFHIHVR